MQNELNNIEAPVLEGVKTIGFIALVANGNPLNGAKKYAKAATAKGIVTKDAKAKAKAEAKALEERILNLFK